MDSIGASDKYYCNAARKRNYSIYSRFIRQQFVSAPRRNTPQPRTASPCLQEVTRLPPCVWHLHLQEPALLVLGCHLFQAPDSASRSPLFDCSRLRHARVCKLDRTCVCKPHRRHLSMFGFETHTQPFRLQK